MRRLFRPRVELPTLATGAGARAAARHLAARTTRPEQALDFDACWNEPDVRGALFAMHGRVCAFCLSELPRGDRGDVEHFRPKALYFWLAYDFDNYLLSCSRCNRIFKREHFPLAPGSGRTDHAHRHLLAEEARLLLDPVADPVEDWVMMMKVGALLLWKGAPGLSPGSPEHARVAATTGWFHWNDDPDLVCARTDAIDEALFAAESGNVEAARRSASRFRPHGGAVRSLLCRYGGIAMPTVTEELRWLLEDLREEWAWAERIGGELSRKKQEVLAWTFAVLWKCPPAGAEMRVEAWLEGAGLKARVEPKARALSRVDP